MANILAREVYRMGIVRDDLDNIKQTEATLSKVIYPCYIRQKVNRTQACVFKEHSRKQRIHERSIRAGTWAPVDFGQVE